MLADWHLFCLGLIGPDRRKCVFPHRKGLQSKEPASLQMTRSLLARHHNPLKAQASRDRPPKPDKSPRSASSFALSPPSTLKTFRSAGLSLTDRKVQWNEGFCAFGNQVLLI